LPGARARAASAALLGAALAGVAFGAAGGTELERTSVVEVLAVLTGGALSALVACRGRGRGPGATALVLFAALAALTALSVTWSIVPDLSYVEAGRTFAYLGVFASGIAVARLAPRAPELVIAGVLLAAVAAVTYALLSRVWPATLAANELSNRIGAPFEYWNAVGTTAALAVPGLLWLGSRPTGGGVARSLAYPGMGACILAILLTQSRGALWSGGIAALAWFVLVPRRLRSLPVLLAPAACAGAVGAWALARDPFSKTLQPLAAKESVAGDFGLLLLLMAVVLLLVGLAVNVGLSHAFPPLRVRRRVGLAVAVIACALPLVALTSAAVSGSIGERVDELVSETETAPEQGAGRLTAASSTRGKYWREAGRVFDDRPAAGVGAGAFEVARLRHRKDDAVSRHAHGYGPQTLADLGLVGAGLSLALLVAWLVAAARTTALYPRRLPFRRARGPAPRRDWTSERVAVVALALTAVAFGLQSAIDWTWFVPGPTAMALVAAGFVAGRGPLTAAEPPAAGAPGAARALAAAAVGLAALLAAWAAWQPAASARAVEHARELAEAGSYDEALAESAEAADANPLSPEPLFARAEVLAAAGRERAAAAALEDAVLAFPGDPQTWIHLARFQLFELDRPRLALETLRGALFLDPLSLQAQALYLNARAAARIPG
jgi:hypothetical protein